MKNSPRSPKTGLRAGCTRAALALFLSLTAARAALAVEVTATRIDGTTVRGEWVGAEEAARITLRVDGDRRDLAVDDLLSVDLTTKPASPTNPMVFYLADGGRLTGDLVGEETDTIVARTILGDAVKLPYAKLAAVRVAQDEPSEQSAEAFREALADRLAGQDVLVTRGTEEVKALRGRWTGLNRERGTFVFGDRERTIQFERIFGVVFAAGAAKPQAHPLTVVLADDSRFSGKMLRADGDSITVQASFGAEIVVPLTGVRALRVRSARVTYLSDLAPKRESAEGRLHRPWAVQRDRNVSGGPLLLGGTRFDKGLGVHSQSELAYDLDGRFETLVAVIGLDDAVRPHGTVVFRVLGDGRDLLDLGIVSGGDPPIDLKVDVLGVKELALIVEYGDELDLSDQADWGGARLIGQANAAARKP